MGTQVINNRTGVEDLLVFQEDRSIYYFLQVIRRRKDNPDLDVSEVSLGSWYLTSSESLDRYWPVVKCLCDNFGARAYISLIPRSMEKLGTEMLMECSKRVGDRNFKRIYKVPERAALSRETIKTKPLLPKSRWMLDIDNSDPDNLNILKGIISGFTDIRGTLKTPNGYHMIVDSFNPGLLSDQFKYHGDSDFTLKSNVQIGFTLNRDCNTVLYYSGH